MIVRSEGVPASGPAGGRARVGHGDGGSGALPATHRVRSVEAGLLLLVVIYAGQGFEPVRSWLPEGSGALLIQLGYIAPAALVWARVLRDPSRRPAWTAMAIGMTSYAVANAYFLGHLGAPDPVPFPSWADAGFLAFYPCAAVAIVLKIRSRAGRVSKAVWLDGAISSFGVGTLISTFVLGVLVTSPDATLLAKATALAYPTSDALLLGMVVGSFVLVGDGGRARTVLAAGLVLLTGADTVYVTQAATDGYGHGGMTDLAYMAGMGLIAVAAWTPESAVTARRRGLTGTWGMAIPAAFAVISLAVVLYSATGNVPPIAVGLATACLLASLLRAVLSVRELQSLASARVEARRDELTGLANRRGFHEHLGAQLRRRRPSAPVAVLLVDLDRFKEVNDSFGHQFGDRVLREAGPRMQAALRSADHLARLGGDEFVAVLTGADANRANVGAIAERLRAELQRPFEIDGRSIRLDASIGVAVCPADGVDTDSLLQRADIAMYTAKASRGGFEFYRQHSDRAARSHLEAAEALREDVATDAMVLHYQPKLDLPSGLITGVEALVRWDRPGQGLVAPDDFLPIVEKAGLMPALTMNVLAMAIVQCAQWRAEGLDLSMAVNLSTLDLTSAYFPDQVYDMLTETGVPAERLELEITESTLMADPEGARGVIEQLDGLGLRISIDDYGTGYSSLAYLQTLPARELKLDRAFLIELADHTRSAAIVKSTIDLAHALGMVMVAEGVESATTLAHLTDWGCDAAQGYYIGRPQPPDVLTPWLRDHAAPEGWRDAIDDGIARTGPPPEPPTPTA